MIIICLSIFLIISIIFNILLCFILWKKEFLVNYYEQKENDTLNSKLEDKILTEKSDNIIKISDYIHRRF